MRNAREYRIERSVVAGFVLMALMLPAFAGVDGGAGNTVGGQQATVAGGYRNAASGLRATVAGGVLNTAAGANATVAGGSYNAAKADYTTVAGGGPGDLQSPTTTNNRATDTYCTVGGGGANVAGNDDATVDNASGATVGGGYFNFAFAPSATVGGGWNNFAMVQYAAAGGGIANQVYGLAGTIAGGHNNQVNASYGTVGGGRINLVNGEFATVSGGGPDLNDGNSGFSTRNKALDNFCTVGGGSTNIAGSDDADNTTARYATVGGGRFNTASGAYATVGGGYYNTATADYATVAGGGPSDPGNAEYNRNRATDTGCFGGGGLHNQAGNDDADTHNSEYTVVCGGTGNTADGTGAAVVGGCLNRATGIDSMIVGGYSNVAEGICSFASGYHAFNYGNGSFVWADYSTSDVLYVPNANRFVARAAGGVYFYTSSTLGTGVYVGAGGTGWSATSDRNAKENINEVKATDVLDKVAALPISTWNLKEDAAKVQHMGPMAQDLYAAFGLGDSDKAINSVDADGIALASIQGLYKQNAEQASQIKAQQDQIQGL